jgi:hypothetical protein
VFHFRVISVLLFLSAGGSCLGDVVVLANRTSRDIAVRVLDGLVVVKSFTIGALDVVPIETDGPCEVEVALARAWRKYALNANEAYYFGSLPNGQVQMQQIGLGSDVQTQQGRKLPGAGRDVATISVKILVDEEEPEIQRRWQERLRRRVEAASAVLERYCRLRLEVVAFGTWGSDNATQEFHKSMAEFEREVDPAPARLAIGFSSQYHVPQDQAHIGGTRGPLHSHILHREWSRHVDERLRLEVLVHELGHYLGAAHSPEPTSVMRPVFGNRQSQPAGLRIRFDPVNTLTMNLVTEEMRRRNVRGFAGLTPETKKRLGQIYGELSRANPEDDSARRFVQLVEHQEAPHPLEEATRRVLDALIDEGDAGGRLVAEPGAADRGDGAQAGDRLTQRCVRRAAQAAARLDEALGPRALVLALGIAVDDVQALRAFPATAKFVRSVQTEEEAARRRESLGEPTLKGRADLAKHFFISAHLAAALGPQAAAATGEAKELLDATAKSGFSFADTAANRSGIQFARRVLDRSISLDDLAARGLAVSDFLPDLAGLEEGLSLAAFREKYGGKTDERYLAQIKEIDRRIANLPPYRSGQAGPIKE